MSYFFTSESVSEGHPDKVADQISDAILDHFIAFDPSSKVACETLVTTGQVVLAGEIKSSVYLDVQKIARKVINNIGYTKSDYMFDGEACGVLSALHEQSQEINQGVERANPEDQGAGDQGMMFGYATNESSNKMPIALELSHLLLEQLAKLRREGDVVDYLRPDSKAQVTIEYNDDHTPKRIDSIVISTQHDPFHESDQKMLEKIRKDMIEILVPQTKALCDTRVQQLFNDDIKYYINPTGKFVIGGPHGDTGLTGRKIIVDTYGGKGAHGGGAFSGKDPSKVDRSAAYAARHIARNMVAAGVADEILIQVSYAIGEPEPMGIFVNTYNRCNVSMSDGEIAEKIKQLWDLRPYYIEKNLKLRNPMYLETASYGHMGREHKIVKKTFERPENGGIVVEEREVELFTWEKEDRVDEVKQVFGL